MRQSRKLLTKHMRWHCPTSGETAFEGASDGLMPGGLSPASENVWVSCCDLPHIIKPARPDLKKTSRFAACCTQLTRLIWLACDKSCLFDCVGFCRCSLTRGCSWHSLPLQLCGSLQVQLEQGLLLEWPPTLLSAVGKSCNVCTHNL